MNLHAGSTLSGRLTIMLTCDTSLWVEELEPLLRDEAQPHFAGLHRAHPPGEIDLISLLCCLHGRGAGWPHQHQGPGILDWKLESTGLDSNLS